MYTETNFKTKKALKEAVAQGAAQVRVFYPGIQGDKLTGTHEVSVEGPHYPAAHTWYARVKIVNGVVTKVVG